MQRQRNSSQVKEQEKSPEKKLNEMEASKLQDTEFKTMVIWMLKKLSDNFKSTENGIEIIKINQSEIKDTLTEMKNNLQGIYSRVD